MKKTYTIKDIASMAEVSKGTVDRVLHKRGKVSQKALERVNEVLDKIDYQPNIMARNLKNTKTYRICVLIPNPISDPYWRPCIDGISEAKNEYKSFNITIEAYFFDPSSTTSFIETNESLLKTSPDAVLLVPLFYLETVSIINNYNSLGIISGTFNNQLESNHISTFVGQDLFKSGRVAARLMDLLIKKNSSIAIIHIDEDVNNALHMQEKERGFRKFFDEFEKFNLITLKLEQPRIKEEMTKFLKAHPDLSGIFVTTSKAHQIAEITSKIRNKKIVIVGYDLLKSNIEYLNNKMIDFLIHQNPRKQAYLGTSLLIEHFIFNKKIPKEILLPIEIVNSENVNEYIN